MIMLGNLTVKQIETRLGIELTESERKTLNESRQDSANDIGKNEWHCFDIPFVILCGEYDTAMKIKDILSPYANEFKQILQIGIK